ncbi:hypothetical protein NDU88_002752 [Pleurodeles waltl]|uniref:Uncharacterized protein n=1 Tax=Pleurodeles waltl TaxID=8319 RepID=A0AAV7VE65_PLEWA|nr:hypothetical protein NDU88_002752 [Pleurodeles waltl]
MNRQVEDTIPQQDAPTNLEEQASERLRQCGSANDRVSSRRRARDSPLQVSDQVLIKKRRPGGKFRLPFELVPWTVVRIRGTMVTAVKGNEQVTGNISFLKHYLSEDLGAAGDTPTPSANCESKEAVDDCPDILESGVPTLRDDCPEDTVVRPRGETEGQERDSQSPTQRPNGNTETLMNVPPQVVMERYHLRPQPVPSSKLKDFLLM